MNTILKNQFVLILFLLCAFAIKSLYGEESTADPNQPPQILTSDLIRKQIVYGPTKNVSFVFVDDDKIMEIYINQKPQQFEAASTVVIDKRFKLKRGITTLVVAAVDEAGNRREKSYLIVFGKNETTPGESEKRYKLRLAGQGSLAYEVDDNPTQDLSSPIKIGDLEVQGVIPDDEQPDSRTVLKGKLFLNYGTVTGFIGAEDTSYSKAENDFLNSRAILAGMAYATAIAESWKFLFTYIWLDINVGNADFSQNHLLSPGFQIQSQDEEGTYKNRFGLDLTIKDFADDDYDAGSEMALKWDYDGLELDGMDRYRHTIAVGSVDDGTETSKHRYLNMDFDWYNRWDSGVAWDIGFGYQYRRYDTEKPLKEDTVLGSKRVDMPMRLSTAVGYFFTEQFSVMLKYKNETNLSNKSPYVRNIYGITASGQY